MDRTERIELFTAAIWEWYKTHKRTLPWRDLSIDDDTQRAYQIWISEVMLQQTQVPRVKVAYKRFLWQFPRVQDLAVASNKDVILAWRGMGYNSRALRLRDAAKVIAGSGAGVRTRKKPIANSQKPVLSPVEGSIAFPTDMKSLQSLPGIGHYTAAAIRNFAFGLATPCLDTNIKRILHRVFVGAEGPGGHYKKDDAYLLGIAEEVLTVALRSGSTADWHAALMDYGSLVQTKTSPKWEQCILSKQGIMKTTQQSFEKAQKALYKPKKKEPGRMVGSKYVPNRIFRGKIIEELRDAPAGMSLEDIGQHVCLDWDQKEHTEWLESLVKNLKDDHLVKHTKNKKWALKE